MNHYAIFQHEPYDWRITCNGYVMRDENDKPYTFERVQDANRAVELLRALAQEADEIKRDELRKAGD